MTTVVRMPEVMANATEAALQGWLVGVGDAVSVGQPLAEVETEKAMVEYNAEVDGTLLRVLIEPGSTVDVGTPIAVIGAAGTADAEVDRVLAASGVDAGTSGAASAASAAPDTAATATAASAQSAEPAAPASAPQPTASGREQGRLFASPLVRRLARERGLDLSTMVGTGPGGRIVRRDLEMLPAARPTSAPEAFSSGASATSDVASGYVEIPHSGMRRAIARRLVESKSTIPHFYLVAECRVDELLALRRRINESSPVKISVNDFVVKAVAAAMVDVPDANVTWTDAALRRWSSVDIAIAVATDGGLLTPVLRGVERRTLSDISTAIAELAARARAGRLRQDELEGGSFSVTNLGMYGTGEFSAIINPPQSGILAIGAAKQQPVVQDGELAVATVMTCTLSADHRAIDGALAARWLAAFTARIENPLGMLV
ncbi:pyruvate dehydrogenase complex dihydrolipoamide acetyltransferase [Parafrigoribacterium mesophilum]|uniref:dihydrolipoamide acetyltransferase family protein n=1 Tax=Parafrigoribacterium mesophilum TaxID=433646 RepID=UPI0031FC92BE